MHPFNEQAIRPCGSLYAYCNGNCAECEVNNTYATTSTEAVSRYATSSTPDYDVDAFGKPSKEVYDKAKKDKDYAANALFLCRKRRDNLIDELVREREHEKLYMDMYEKQKDIIRKYEIYEEIESNG
jgi:hypothetical protein